MLLFVIFQLLSAVMLVENLYATCQRVFTIYLFTYVLVYYPRSVDTGELEIHISTAHSNLPKQEHM